MLIYYFYVHEYTYIYICICIRRERPNYMHIQCYNIHICLLSLVHLCHVLFSLFVVHLLICHPAVLPARVSNRPTALFPGYTPDGKLWALNEGGAPFRFNLDKALSIPPDFLDGRRRWVPGRRVEWSGWFPGFFFGVGSFLLLQTYDVFFRKCNQQRFEKVDVVLYRFVASLHWKLWT